MSLVLPYSDWPAADRQMWSMLVEAGGPLDDAGALSGLRATSLRTLQLHYGRWLAWLVTNEPECLGEAPAARASMTRLTRWLEALAHVRPMTRLAFVGGTLRTLRAAEPDRDWRAQRRLEALLKRAAGDGDPSRKAGRILSTAVLLEAGLRLAGPDAEAATTPLEAAKRRRNGAMIAMLALMPIRRRGFAGLRIGTSVHVGVDEIVIALPEELTKSGVPWEAAVPVQVEPVLRRYICEVRPWLMSRGQREHDVLWVGDRGAPFEENHFGAKIAGITTKATGVRVPPHFFRDAAATTLARISPQAARLIRPVLSHSGYRTAERHYIHANTIEAGRGYADLIGRLKRPSK